MTLQKLAQQLKHLPGKHSQASHASGKAGMPSRFAREFGMDQGTYDEVAKSLGKDWGQNTLDAYEFKSGGLRSELTSVALTGGQFGGQYQDWVEIRGKVYNEDNRKVGEFVRSIQHEDAIIEHNVFGLDESQQGKGFGSAFYQHNEKAYSKMGIKKIELQANMGVGGYAWARMGVNFKDTREAANIYERFANTWTEQYPNTKPPILTNSWDIAAAKGPDGRRIGKEAMMGSDWEGYKSLDSKSTGNKIGQAYYEARSKRRKSLKQAGKQHIESDTNGFWGVDEADDEWFKLVQDLLE